LLLAYAPILPLTPVITGLGVGGGGLICISGDGGGEGVFVVLLRTDLSTIEFNE